MNKRKAIALTLIAVVAVSAVIGGVVAYMFKQAKQAQSVTAATVSCEVIQSDDSIALKNTGAVTAYLRLRLVTYWVDRSSGDRVYKQSESLDDISYDENYWVKDGDTFYYKSPVATKGVTENLLTSSITLKTEGDYTQVIEVVAEAIQASPGTAVTSAWGVTLEDGNITGKATQ